MGMLGHFTANADPGNWLTHIDSSSLEAGQAGLPSGAGAEQTVSANLSRGSEEVSALDKHVDSGVKLSGF